MNGPDPGRALSAIANPAIPLPVVPSVAAGPGIARLVPPGETIILALRPSVLFIVLSRLESLAAVALGSAGLWWLAAAEAVPLAPWRAVVGGLGAGLLILVHAGGDWLTRYYLLTDRRVIRVRGIVRQSTYDLPLGSVQNVVLWRSARERALGLGTPAFASAAATLGEFGWEMVARPADVLRIVRDAIDRYGRHDQLRGLTAGAGQPPGPRGEGP